MAGQPADAFQDREQVPAPVVRAEGMDLVDDDGAHRGEDPGRIDLGADQHRFQRFRGGQQDVGRLAQDALPRRRRHVAVPESGSPAEPARVLLQPGQQVVQQCLERGEVEHRRGIPAAGFHRGEQGKDGRLGLAAGGRREQERVKTVEHRADRLLLERPQVLPAQGVDQMVGEHRMQPVQPALGHGRSRSMSAARRGPGEPGTEALRSSSVSSAGASVRA